MWSVVSESRVRQTKSYTDTRKSLEISDKKGHKDGRNVQLVFYLNGYIILIYPNIYPYPRKRFLFYLFIFVG